MILPRKRKRDSFLPWVQLGVDVVSILLLLRAVFWLRFGGVYFELASDQAFNQVYFRSFLVVAVCLVFFLRSYGLYKPARSYTFADESAKVLKAVVGTTIVLTAATFFIRNFSFWRSFMMLAGVILAVGLSLARVLLGLVVIWVDASRGSFRNILMIGCDENAKKIIHYYKKNPRFSMRVLGILDDQLPRNSQVEGVPVMGKISEVGACLGTHDYIHEVVLVGKGQSTELVLKVLYECEKSMVSFRWLADIFGLIASKMRVSYTAGVPLLSFVDSPLGNWEERLLKRGMDISVSLASLFIFSPVFAIIALAIKWDSKGPIFYGQERVGEDGRRFVLYKFRTMQINAESKSGPVWAKEDDPRRTRAGAFLRKNNLDELPQLWNVLKGDMSLVGPRPERPFFVSQFKEDIPRYMARHSIRSGITGWAQVNGFRGNTSIEERTKFDLYYIENWSLWLDVKILFMTVFARRNAY